MSWLSWRQRSQQGRGARRACLVFSGLLVCPMGFGCSWAGCSDDGQAQQDTGILDGDLDAGPGRDADSGPDAASDSGVITVQHDFCGQAIFRFPTPRYTATMGGHGVGRDWLVEAWGNESVSWKFPVIFLDPRACVEYRPLPDMAFRDNMALSDRGLVFSADTDDGSLADLFFLEPGSWSLTRLTHTQDLNETSISTASHYVAYDLRWQRDFDDTVEYRGLWLMDMDTLDATMVCPPENWPLLNAMSDRYLVWAANSEDASSTGRDIFFRDLETGQTVHVEASRDGDQYGPWVWDDYIAWNEDDRSPYPPHRLVLYRISTGERTLIAEESGLFSFAMGSGLLIWPSTRNNEQEGASGDVRDLYAYDIRTGLERRLTTHPFNIWIGPQAIETPYFMVAEADERDQGAANAYVVNLSLLGVVDDEGNLLPGDPVIDSLPSR